VHFRREWGAWRRLGYKALAVNLSDIAAMGGRPLDAYVALAVPADRDWREIEALYAGLRDLARRTGVNVLGGDTSAAPDRVFLAITVVGTPAGERILYRHGARPGDRIVVTGWLGDAAAGLCLLDQPASISSEDAAQLITAQLEPELYLSEAALFARSGAVHALIDVSDGLVVDLGRLCQAGGLGAELEAAALPVSPALRAFCAATERDPLELALGGGEDYRLLAAVEPNGLEELREVVRRQTGRELHIVGTFTTEPGLRIRSSDGTLRPLPHLGFEHFRPTGRDAATGPAG